MPRYVNLANLEQFAAINLTADPGYDPDNPTIPSCAQIVVTWGLAGGTLIGHNVLHGTYSGPFSGSQVQADAILTGLTTGANWTALQAFLSINAFIRDVTIRNLALVDQPIISSLGSGAAGLSTDPELPSEVAAVITKRTGSVGPANRGRLYIPGFAANATTPQGTIAAGAVTALGNWGSIIAGVLQASGYIFGIGHHARKAYIGVSGKQHPARLAGVVPITNVAVIDNHWDTQRRRGFR